MSDFKVGDPVVMLGKSHIAGRIGKVIEVGQAGNPDRVHVHWTAEEGGFPIKWRGSETTAGLKTWVSSSKIRKQ